MLMDVQELVDDLVRDESGQISAESRNRAITLALARYSEDRPREIVADVAAPGGRSLALGGVEGWEDGFSRVLAIEVLPESVPPRVLESWSMYRSASGEWVHFADSVAVSLRLRFTASRRLTDAVDDVPLRDREPLANWAAALLLDQLATAFAGDRQATIRADSVDHGSKSGDYGRRAAAARRFYLDRLGLDSKRQAPAGAVASLPSRRRFGGRS
jgi:hypothetical protein